MEINSITSPPHPASSDALMSSRELHTFNWIIIVCIHIYIQEVWKHGKLSQVYRRKGSWAEGVFKSAYTLFRCVSARYQPTWNTIKSNILDVEKYAKAKRTHMTGTGKYLINKQHLFDTNNLSFSVSRRLSHTNSNSSLPHINNQGRGYDEISWTIIHNSCSQQINLVSLIQIVVRLSHQTRLTTAWVIGIRIVRTKWLTHSNLLVHFRCSWSVELLKKEEEWRAINISTLRRRSSSSIE